jgi:excisionase family DNA binding protein
MRPNVKANVRAKSLKLTSMKSTPKKTSDFSLHQFPTTNMLKELKTATDMNIRVLVGQTEAIPDEVAPGLSPALAAAVPEASRLDRKNDWKGGNMITIRVGELASALGVHRNTIRNWIKSGVLDAHPTVAKKYAIRK